MAKLLIFVVAALAFSAALAAPKKNHQRNQIEEVADQVKVVVDDVSTSLKKVLPDEKQISQDLAQKSQQFVKDVEGIVNKLRTEIEKNKGPADELLQQVTGKLTENLQALKQAVGPDATAKGNEIRTQLETHFKNSATEVEKLVGIVKPNLDKAGETVNTFAKGILDDFLKAAQGLKTEVDSTIQGRAIKH